MAPTLLALSPDPGAEPAAPADREAFWRAVWETESRPLHGFLRRHLRDADQAEDLLQETFVKAIRSGRLEGGAGARAYLFTIAQNLAADHWRRRLRLVPGPSPADGGEEVFEIPDRVGESPEAAASRRGLERRLSAALAAMPERYRIAFRLAAVEQRSYREIAHATGWSLDQVRINVHRARRRLIDELGPELVAEIRS